MQDDPTWQDPQQAHELTDAGVTGQQIDFDLNCVRCGYNLRGISAIGRCPECGEPVETTLRPDLLHMADPDWLGKLRKGSNWLIAAIVMNLAMIPIGMVIGIATVASSIGQGGTLPMPALIFLSVLGLIITGVYAVAVWNLSEPETDVFEIRTSCKLMRWLIVPAMLIGIVTEFLNISGQTPLLYAAAGIDFLTSIMMLVGFLAGLWYLRHLADRIPEPSLAKQTMTVYWGYLVAMSIAILFGTGMTLFALASSNTANPASAAAFGAIGLIMCPVGLALLIFIIWWIVLMFRYRTRFTQAHEIAMGQQRTAYNSTPAI